MTDQANFVLSTVYPSNIYPLSCVLSGSRAYGLNVESSDWDYLGLHLMDSRACLQPPGHEDQILVYQKAYDQDYKETLDPGSYLSLVSYEVWRFLDQIERGGFQSYELLYLPQIYSDSSTEYLISLLRELITNKIGLVAEKMARNSRTTHPTSRKAAVICGYRLLQAILFLTEEEFAWHIDDLCDHFRDICKVYQEIVAVYVNPETRRDPLTAQEQIDLAKEFSSLYRELERARIITRIPGRYSPRVYQEALSVLLKIRASLI